MISSGPAMLPNSDLREIEDLELSLLLAAIYERYGYDFRNYARSALSRRIKQILESENLKSVSDLQERILYDAVFLDRFLATLASHSPGVFRDPEFFKTVRETVVPRLRTYPSIRIWLPGCST